MCLTYNIIYHLIIVIFTCEIAEIIKNLMNINQNISVSKPLSRLYRKKTNKTNVINTYNNFRDRLDAL